MLGGGGGVFEGSFNCINISNGIFQSDWLLLLLSVFEAFR